MRTRAGLSWILGGLAIVAVIYFIGGSGWYYRVIPDAWHELDPYLSGFFREGWGYAFGSLMMIWGAYRMFAQRKGTP